MVFFSFLRTKFTINSFPSFSIDSSTVVGDPWREPVGPAVVAAAVAAGVAAYGIVVEGKTFAEVDDG